jgi:hypothetical protein
MATFVPNPEIVEGMCDRSLPMATSKIDFVPFLDHPSQVWDRPPENRWDSTDRRLIKSRSKEKRQAVFACLNWRERTKNYCEGDASNVQSTVRARIYLK